MIEDVLRVAAVQGERKGCASSSKMRFYAEISAKRKIETKKINKKKKKQTNQINIFNKLIGMWYY